MSEMTQRRKTMNNNEPRENQNISVDEVIELACVLAHQELISYWDTMQVSEAMEYEVEGEVLYTDIAQDKFNKFYDDVERRIVELMHTHPTLHIHDIKASLLHEKKTRLTTKKGDNMKTYNHAFDLAWAVLDSQYEDGYDCLEHEKEKVFAALLKRVQELMDGRYPREYLEAIGHFDTYQEETSTDETETEND
jgi:hypothetical protein